MNAVGQYHAQNGVFPTGGPDPWVVNAIRRAGAQVGATPAEVALDVATSLQETGAQRGRVGDNGTSVGPFQHHIGGALGNHPLSWANTFAAVLERVGALHAAHAQHGKGAAAVQRPADQALYSRGVDSLLPQAWKLLGSAPSAEGLLAPHAPPAGGGGGTPQDRLALVDYFRQPQETRNIADLIGLVGAQHPVVGSPALAGPLAALVAGGQTQAPATAGHGSPIGVTGAKLIGVPYQGTHTKYGNWESDNAIDIPAPVGTPIYATQNGTIGSQIGALNSSDPHLLGLRVHLDSPGQHSYYAHLSKLAVKAGEHVTKGQIIGYSGAANGVSHLHFAVQNGDPRRYYA